MINIATNEFVSDVSSLYKYYTKTRDIFVQSGTRSMTRSTTSKNLEKTSFFCLSFCWKSEKNCSEYLTICNSNFFSQTCTTYIKTTQPGAWNFINSICFTLSPTVHRSAFSIHYRSCIQQKSNIFRLKYINAMVVIGPRKNICFRSLV